MPQRLLALILNPMGTHGHIRVLPLSVANKIAAGEVVERPASVVKELMENAVDAGATRIDVDITAGGRKLISVRDDGTGMGRDDALLCIEPQATSKIKDIEDIERIDTLGFRGEALAAIASVSRFRLTTCLRGEDSGTELLFTGGKLQDVRDTSCPAGTGIEVRDLFFNVPARRKFLRTHQTELSHVRARFIEQALGGAAISMSLRVDGQDVYRSAATTDPSERICELFGTDLQKNLRPVNIHGDGLEISGYVSLPGVNRSDRNEQYIFINNRCTSAPLIGYAIREAYHALVPKNRHPSVFLFLKIDPEQVDVNVHPTKKEVRFRKPGAVRDALIGAIRSSLSSGAGVGMSAAGAEEAMPGSPPARPIAVTQMIIENLPQARAFRYPKISPTEPAEIRPGTPAAALPPVPGEDGERPAASDGISAPWTWCRVVGLLGNYYVVLETEDGFVLMDPRAAHERVLYEHFMSEVTKDSIEVQSMLMPETVEMRPKDAMRVRKNLGVMKKMGFGISEFGGDAFVVDAMPSHFKGAEAAAILVEVSLSLEQAGTRGGKGRWREECVAQAACRSAVRARDRLTLEEIEQLVVSLAGTEMPYTCPHGRPTLIFTSYKELDKKFGRRTHSGAGTG